MRDIFFKNTGRDELAELDRLQHEFQDSKATESSSKLSAFFLFFKDNVLIQYTNKTRANKRRITGGMFLCFQ